MTRVFAPPKGFDAPEFGQFFVNGHYDRETDDRLTKAYIDALAAEARRRSATAGLKANALIGKVIRFPWADGYAQYMVWRERPLELVHLPLGDAWQLPDGQLRGLRLTDIRKMVKGEGLWERLAEATDDFWSSQPVGTILHYDNGFQSYVRGVVVDEGGEHKLRPTALVNPSTPANPRAGWKDHDLPRRMPDGSVNEPYHAKKVREGSAWRCNETCVYEWKLANGKVKPGEADPRGMPPIDLTPPAGDAEAQRLCRLVQDAKVILGESLGWEPTPADWRRVIDAAISKLWEA